MDEEPPGQAVFQFGDVADYPDVQVLQRSLSRVETTTSRSSGFRLPKPSSRKKNSSSPATSTASIFSPSARRHSSSENLFLLLLPASPLKGQAKCKSEVSRNRIVLSPVSYIS